MDTINNSALTRLEQATSQEKCRNVLLFGPPGVGKTTIVKRIQDLGGNAYDLEELCDMDEKLARISSGSGTVYGAADLDPLQDYPGCIKVFLYGPQRLYKARRRNRDKLNPGKASQAHHKMSDWWDFRCDISKAWFDFCLNVFDCFLDECCHYIQLAANLPMSSKLPSSEKGGQCDED